MRFKITLKINREYGSNLAFNYQYEQSAVIYHILAKADKEYSSWLHKNGYSLNGTKRFKLFSYSPFIFNKVKAIPEAGCLNIIEDTATWYINFVPEKSTEEFIQGIFAHQRFVIGNKKFKVVFNIIGVETISMSKLSEEMEFQALSPICVKQHLEGHIKYLSPDNPQFAQGIFRGLIAKYESIYEKMPKTNESDFDFKIVGDKIKSKLITIKADTPYETKVRGFLFNFRLKAPIELMKIAYEGGIGEQCSQGFGFITKK